MRNLSYINTNNMDGFSIRWWKNILNDISNNTKISSVNLLEQYRTKWKISPNTYQCIRHGIPNPRKIKAISAECDWNIFVSWPHPFDASIRLNSNAENHLLYIEFKLGRCPWTLVGRRVNSGISFNFDSEIVLTVLLVFDFALSKCVLDGPCFSSCLGNTTALFRILFSLYSLKWWIGDGLQLSWWLSVIKAIDMNDIFVIKW